MSLVQDILRVGFEQATQEELDSLRISVSALIYKKGAIVILEHNKTNLATLPGGKLEKGERPIEGLMRELREEIGVENVTIEGAPSVNTGVHSDLHICYVVSTPDEIKNLEKDKHGEVYYCSKTALPYLELTESAKVALTSFNLIN